jgi:hypothetical protein
MRRICVVPIPSQDGGVSEQPPPLPSTIGSKLKEPVVLQGSGHGFAFHAGPLSQLGDCQTALWSPV